MAAEPMADGGARRLDPVDLVQRAANGDSVAFEQLYRLHAARVHAVCSRLSRDPAHAEDCTQEASSAPGALPRFEARSAFGTWLHRIAVNVVMDGRRGAGPLLEFVGELPRSRRRRRCRTRRSRKPSSRRRSPAARGARRAGAVRDPRLHGGRGGRDARPRRGHLQGAGASRSPAVARAARRWRVVAAESGRGAPRGRPLRRRTVMNEGHGRRVLSRRTCRRRCSRGAILAGHRAGDRRPAAGCNARSRGAAVARRAGFRRRDAGGASSRLSWRRSTRGRAPGPTGSASRPRSPASRSARGSAARRCWRRCAPAIRRCRPPRSRPMRASRVSARRCWCRPASASRGSRAGGTLPGGGEPRDAAPGDRRHPSRARRGPGNLLLQGDAGEQLPGRDPRAERVKEAATRPGDLTMTTSHLRRPCRAAALTLAALPVLLLPVAAGRRHARRQAHRRRAEWHGGPSNVAGMLAIEGWDNPRCTSPARWRRRRARRRAARRRAGGRQWWCCRAAARCRAGEADLVVKVPAASKPRGLDGQRRGRDAACRWRAAHQLGQRQPPGSTGDGAGRGEDRHGDASLRGGGGSTTVRLSSVSGDVRIRAPRRRARVNTVSGDLQLALGTLRSLRLRSTSGDPQPARRAERDASLEAESVSGDLDPSRRRGKLDPMPRTSGGDIATCYGARQLQRHGAWQMRCAASAAAARGCGSRP